MWCRIAWPNTRSKVASSKGRLSASVATVVTSRPRRFALASSASSIPGEMSVAVALPIVSACSRLSVK